MSTTTTNDIELDMYRRDAQAYVIKSRRPAVPAVKQIISSALANGAAYDSRVRVSIPRDLAERFLRLSKNPIRLPVSYASLNHAIREQLNTTARITSEFTVEDDDFDHDEDEIQDPTDAPLGGDDSDDEDITMHDVVGSADDAIDEVTVAQDEDSDAENLPADEPGEVQYTDGTTSTGVVYDREGDVVPGEDVDAAVESPDQAAEPAPVHPVVEAQEVVESPSGVATPVDPRSDQEREVDAAVAPDGYSGRYTY